MSMLCCRKKTAFCNIQLLAIFDFTEKEKEIRKVTNNFLPGGKVNVEIEKSSAFL